MSQGFLLDTERTSERATALENYLKKRIKGQDRAVEAFVKMVEIFEAGLTEEGRPISSLLFLGPTGSGKTLACELLAKFMTGSVDHLIKIDCAEFQHSHEIAKLIGSPPGYTGHRETPPVLRQKNLNKGHTETHKFTVVLFDEIEKAHESVWKLMLGILDKAKLTLGDNQVVDFSRCVVVMTSNLGSKEINDLAKKNLGFAPKKESNALDQDIYKTATAAANGNFDPEFMNRIDKVIVFRRLTEDTMREILDIELDNTAYKMREIRQFYPFITQEGKDALLAEGFDKRYGARHLKRAIKRFIVHPIARLFNTNQISGGDEIEIDWDTGSKKMTFRNYGPR